MTPRMDRARAVNLPPVVLWLSVVLIGVHALRQFIGEATDERILYTFAFIPARYDPFGTLIPGGAAARIWSPVTYAFLHGDWMHLLVNIVWMASFGGPLARRFGAARFLFLSLISAVAGAALHYALHQGDQGLVIGASGAISGIMAGTSRFAFSPNGPLAGGGPASFNVRAESLARAARNGRAIAFVLIWFGTNVIFGAVPGIAGTSMPIAWEAHIGGFLAGLLVFPLLDPIRRAPPPGEKLAS
jgi:membrane associated rhomboid family serine protease